MSVQFNTETLVQFAKSHGASSAFQAVLRENVEGQRHLAREKTARALENGIAMEKIGMGHFMEALFKGNTNKAYNRADYTNTELMEAAL